MLTSFIEKSSSPSPSPSLLPLSYSAPPLIITFIVFLVLFIIFFTIFFCRCFMQHILDSWYITVAGYPICPTKNEKGLDPLIIQSFPTFIYSSVQDYGEGKFGIECAICLVEFVDNSFIRLLTCNHVFHQECIDYWLKSHKTCPVCRANLDSVQCTKLQASCTQSPMHGTSSEGESSENACNNDINCGTTGSIELQKNGKKFTRSQSTGHSIIIIRENEDRFTMRLPQHVINAKNMKGHNTMRSCINFGEMNSKTISGNCRFGEVLKLSTFLDKV
ncbi:hypothetical protein EJD97_010007 [Solanum chilense]|uniref:RING-type E3 ubiquitin transferase n=1 Tax=Solanum chilense TaxID=4083 RepID=A0A6N2BHY2_SOLCI|nr:hypothetical protein EJD97_010007 [Solanum chilense]